jgi:hypothetical protein
MNNLEKVIGQNFINNDAKYKSNSKLFVCFCEVFFHFMYIYFRIFVENFRQLLCYWHVQFQNFVLINY